MCVFSKGLLDPPAGGSSATTESFSKKLKEPHGINKEEKRKLLISLGVEPVTFKLGRALGYAASTLGIGTATGVGVPAAGTAVGFTANGIAAGSIAAATQAGIGNVAAGSTFAALQSFGATGGFALLGPLSLIAGGVALTVGAGTFVGIGVAKHVKEIESFTKTYLILVHV